MFPLQFDSMQTRLFLYNSPRVSTWASDHRLAYTNSRSATPVLYYSPRDQFIGPVARTIYTHPMHLPEKVARTGVKGRSVRALSNPAVTRVAAKMQHDRSRRSPILSGEGRLPSSINSPLNSTAWSICESAWSFRRSLGRQWRSRKTSFRSVSYWNVIARRSLARTFDEGTMDIVGCLSVLSYERVRAWRNRFPG